MVRLWRARSPRARPPAMRTLPPNQTNPPSGGPEVGPPPVCTPPFGTLETWPVVMPLDEPAVAVALALVPDSRPGAAARPAARPRARPCSTGRCRCDVRADQHRAGHNAATRVAGAVALVDPHRDGGADNRCGVHGAVHRPAASSARAIALGDGGAGRGCRERRAVDRPAATGRRPDALVHRCLRHGCAGRVPALTLFVTVTEQVIWWAESLSEPLHWLMLVTSEVEWLTNVPFPGAHGPSRQSLVRVVVDPRMGAVDRVDHDNCAAHRRRGPLRTGAVPVALRDRASSRLGGPGPAELQHAERDREQKERQERPVRPTGEVLKEGTLFHGWHDRSRGDVSSPERQPGTERVVDLQ